MGTFARSRLMMKCRKVNVYAAFNSMSQLYEPTSKPSGELLLIAITYSHWLNFSVITTTIINSKHYDLLCIGIPMKQPHFLIFLKVFIMKIKFIPHPSLLAPISFLS